MKKQILALGAAMLCAGLSATAQNSFHFNNTDGNTRQDIGVSSGVLTIGQFVDNCTGDYPENINWDNIMVGIGLSNPTNTLHVLGKFRYQDGSEQNNYILTSDANGVATWTNPATLGGGADDDWYTVGTTTAPTNINDDKYTMGLIGIGTTTPVTRLHVDDGMARISGSIDHSDLSTTSFFTNGPNTGLQLEDDTDFGGLLLDKNSDDNLDFTLYFGDNPSGTNAMKFCFANWNGSSHVFSELMRLDVNGYLGIGTASASYRLDLPNTAGAGGQGRANAWNIYSDARLKTNVQNIGYGLNTIMELAPKSYFQHNATIANGTINISQDQGANSIGFIAQELYQMVPEAVQKPTDESKDLWSVDYTKLVPVLVQAIKDQQVIIEDQQQKFDELSKKVDQLQQMLNAQATSMATNDNQLQQNVPNPFTEQTRIDYKLANGGLINLSIYSEDGRLVEVLVEEQQTPGSYSKVWNAANAQPGTYIYILKQDGNILMKKAVKL